MPTESTSKARLETQAHATVVWAANGDGVKVQPDADGSAFLMTGQSKQHPLDVVPALLDADAVRLLAWTLLAAVDGHMTTTVLVCGECGEQATEFQWTLAWHEELRLRKQGLGAYSQWHKDDYGEQFGLAGHAICPRCKYDHSDDESSFVDEIEGRVVAVDP